MLIVFRTEDKLIKELLPPPFEFGSKSGLALVWFTEIVSVSDSNLDMAFINPERAQYRECLLGVNCKIKGSEGFFIPYIWVDNDFTLMRGFIQGFPKKLGRIYMTRLHELTPKIGGRKSGAKVKGLCESHGERIITGNLKLEHKTTPEELPKIKFFLMRHFPDIEKPNTPSVHDITENIIENIQFGDVWTGKADLKFGQSELEEIADLTPKEILSGFYFSTGFTISGGKIIHKYVK